MKQLEFPDKKILLSMFNNKKICFKHQRSHEMRTVNLVNLVTCYAYTPNRSGPWNVSTPLDSGALLGVPIFYGAYFIQSNFPWERCMVFIYLPAPSKGCQNWTLRNVELIPFSNHLAPFGRSRQVNIPFSHGKIRHGFFPKVTFTESKSQDQRLL